MNNELTEKDRLEFFNYVLKWQEELGLQKWSVMLSNKPTKNLAELSIDQNKEHKLCSVLVGKNWKSLPVNSYNLELVACHEMVHLLLHDFKEYIQEHPHDETGIMEKEHEIVNTLERKFIGPPKY
jgi:hypothetical protein